MTIRQLALIVLFTVPCAAAPAGAAKDSDNGAWFDGFYPYRVKIQLDRAAQGPVTVDVTPEQVIDALRPVALDQMRLETFSFDRAVLVDPTTGKAVGGYKLVPRETIDIDGDFARLAKEQASPWKGLIQGEMSFENTEPGDRPGRALWISKQQITNSKLAQIVTLRKDALYLLEYSVLGDAIDNTIDVNLYDPDRWYMSSLPGSYVVPLTPQKQWTRLRTLRRASVEKAELRVATAFTGRCAAADLKLRRVEWKLVADLPRASDRLDLYCIAMGGHLMTQPVEQLIGPAPANEGGVSQISAEAADLNPDGILIGGESVRGWTVPSDLPLIAERISASVPRRPQAGRPAQLKLFRGGASTLLLAIQTRTPQVRFLETGCDLPLQVRFERVAEVPLFDGPFPTARQIETRFDPLMPIDSKLVPPGNSGIHLLAVTFTAPPQARPAVHTGAVRIKVQTQELIVETLEFPVEVSIAPVSVKPMWHFGTLIGSGHQDVRTGKSKGVTHDGLTMSEFHGLKRAPQSLRDAYNDRLIDYCIGPQHLSSKNVGCEVVEQGEGKAPLLRNWDFEGLDHAIDRFILKRDMPWLAMFHSNGDIMHYIRLPNGTNYSFKPADGTRNWVQLPPEEYYKLIGDYFEATAEHLERRGVLDRAVFVIDESSPESYQTIYDYTQAVKSRPFGKRIRFGHTTYKTSTYTRRAPDGALLLDHALDMPMPNNDEHFNFFEPEFNARMKRPGKRQWVYYVESTHFSLDYAGLSTIFTPLKLRHFGGEGWYCWASAMWSMPYEVTAEYGPRWKTGPVVNPWLNPFYHHGPGVLSFFYPPDPRGPTSQPTEQIVPSYRLALIRDGIQDRALLEVLITGTDDAGEKVQVDKQKLADAQKELDRLWTVAPVQWYLSYGGYRRAVQLMWDAIAPAAAPGNKHE